MSVLESVRSLRLPFIVEFLIKEFHDERSSMPPLCQIIKIILQRMNLVQSSPEEKIVLVTDPADLNCSVILDITRIYLCDNLIIGNAINVICECNSNFHSSIQIEYIRLTRILLTNTQFSANYDVPNTLKLYRAFCHMVATTECNFGITLYPRKIYQKIRQLKKVHIDYSPNCDSLKLQFTIMGLSEPMFKELVEQLDPEHEVVLNLLRYLDEVPPNYGHCNVIETLSVVPLQCILSVLSKAKVLPDLNEVLHVVFARLRLYYTNLDVKKIAFPTQWTYRIISDIVRHYVKNGLLLPSNKDIMQIYDNSDAKKFNYGYIQDYMQHVMEIWSDPSLITGNENAVDLYSQFICDINRMSFFDFKHFRELGFISTDLQILDSMQEISRIDPRDCNEITEVHDTLDTLHSQVRSLSTEDFAAFTANLPDSYKSVFMSMRRETNFEEIKTNYIKLRHVVRAMSFQEFQLFLTKIDEKMISTMRYMRNLTSRAFKSEFEECDLVATD